MNDVGSSTSNHDLTSHPVSTNNISVFSHANAMSEHRSTDEEEDDSSLESETYPPGYLDEIAEEEHSVSASKEMDSNAYMQESCGSGTEYKELPQLCEIAEPSVAANHIIPVRHLEIDQMVNMGLEGSSECQDDIANPSSEEEDDDDEDDDEEDEFVASNHVSDAVKQAQQALSQLQQLDTFPHSALEIDEQEYPPHLDPSSMAIGRQAERDYLSNEELDSNDEDPECPVIDPSMPTPSVEGNVMSMDNPIRRAYICDYCERTFATVKALQSHTIKVHNPEKLSLLQCNICFKTFLDDTKLQEHQSTHNMENTHPCPKCSRRFKSKLKLRDHMACHNPEQRLCCPYKNCEKSFVSKKLYDNHVAKHDNQQLIFTCPVCEMEFKRRSHRSEHVRVAHAGVKAYQCTHPGCNHRFTTENARDNHVTRAHQGSRRYRCSQCSFSASHAPQLEEHCREEHPDMDLSLTARSVHSLPQNTSFPIGSALTPTDTNHVIPGTNHAVSLPSNINNTPLSMPPPPSSSSVLYKPSITQPQISPSKSCDTSITGVPNCFDLEDPTVSNIKQTVNGILADLDRDLYLPKPPITSSTVVSPPTNLLSSETHDPYPNLSRVMYDVLKEAEFSPATASRWLPNCDTFSTEEWIQLQNEERDMGPVIAGCCVLEYPHPFLLSDDINTYNNPGLYVDIFSPKSGSQQAPTVVKRRGRPKKNVVQGDASNLSIFSCEGNVSAPSHLLSSPSKISMSAEKMERRMVEQAVAVQSGKDELRQRGYCEESPRMQNRLSSPLRGEGGMDHSSGFHHSSENLHQYPFQSSSTSPPSSLSNPITSHRSMKNEHPLGLCNSSETGFSVNDDSMAILNELMGGVQSTVGKGRGYPNLNTSFHQTIEENARLHSPSVQERMGSAEGVDLGAQLLSLAAYRHQRQAQGHILEDQDDIGGLESSHATSHAQMQQQQQQSQQHHSSHSHQHAYDESSMDNIDKYSSSINQLPRWNTEDTESNQLLLSHQSSHEQQQQLDYPVTSPHASLGGVMSPSSMPMAALSAADLLRQYSACIDPGLNPETPSSISVWPTSQTTLQSSVSSDNWNSGSTSLPNTLFESSSVRSLQPTPSQHQTSQGTASQSSQHSLYPSSHPRATISSATATSTSYQSPPEHSPSPTPLSVSAHQQQAAMAAMAAAMYQNQATPAFDAASAVTQAQRGSHSLAAMEYHRSLVAANSANAYTATELYYQMAAANAAAYGKYSQLGICSPSGIGGLYGGSGSASTPNGNESNGAAELSAMQRFAGLSMPPSALYSRDAAASAYLNGPSAAAFYAAAAASQAANAPNSYVNSPLMSPHMAYAAASMGGIPTAPPGAMDYLAAAGRHLAADPYHPGYLPHLQ